jgi:hypothetical protein
MRFVHLAKLYDLGELIMLQSLLGGSGIEYVVRHANAGSLYPGVPALTPHVMVDERDVLRAEQLLCRLRLPVRDVSVETSDER